MLTADRRGLLTGFSAFLGVEIVTPLAQALAADMPANGFEGSRMFFSASERATLAALSERIIPTTDTPGAIAAGVPAFIEMMMVDWYQVSERLSFARGLDTLDGFVLARHHMPFAGATPAQQDEAITAAMNRKIPSLPDNYFEHCRQIVILGYYTSEIGATRERNYVPVPGRYDGAFPYANVRRIFSS